MDPRIAIKQNVHRDLHQNQSVKSQGQGHLDEKLPGHPSEEEVGRDPSPSQDVNVPDLEQGRQNGHHHRQREGVGHVREIEQEGKGVVLPDQNLDQNLLDVLLRRSPSPSLDHPAEGNRDDLTPSHPIGARERRVTIKTKTKTKRRTRRTRKVRTRRRTRKRTKIKTNPTQKEKI